MWPGCNVVDHDVPDNDKTVSTTRCLFPIYGGQPNDRAQAIRAVPGIGDDERGVGPPLAPWVARWK